MERLTRKSLEYKDTWIADGSLSNIEGVVRGNAIDRLAELEDVLEKYGIENLDDFIKEYSSRNIKLANDNYVLEQELAELKQQLALTEKALELACEEIGRIEAKFGSAYIRANGYLLDYFKTEAKEMLENE